jgi:fructosamine-3-kinase
MEWIDLRPLDSKSGARMGDKLADLHSKSGDRFGWTIDNFIGATPQKNDPCDSWPEFFRDQRLIFQITLAEENGYTIHSAEPLLGSIETFFDASSLPSPTPLHGDLWGGNAAADEGGDPVLFDPAFYYGDPETDIAFTRFFGGFPQSFYHRYQERIPPRPGWKLRQNLYNLYHVLNHLNLFGSSYLSQANRLIGELNEAVMKGGAGR